MMKPAPVLEDAVRDQLRPLVDELVQRLLPELVAEAVNGNGHAGTKRCKGRCGRLLPASMFEPNRGRCRDCRRAEQQRHREQRRAAADKEEHMPAPEASTSTSSTPAS